MARLAADFPDALIGRLPDLFQILDQHLLQRPGFAVCIDAVAARRVEGVEQFAEDIELQLGISLVADPHRPAVAEPGQPVELHFGQPACTPDAVHDLQLAGRTGRRAQQPGMPALRLFPITGAEQRIEGEGRVPEPAIPVVPVPRSADLLRQRGGRRGDDAAGRPVGQRLQRDQRPFDLIAPRPLIVRARRPFAPEPVGLLEQGHRIALRRRVDMGREPGQLERLGRTGFDRERCEGREVAIVEIDRRGQ